MPLRILIVDDNPTFVAALRQFLDFMPGAEVVGNACSAEEALGSARLLAPDLVLIDVEIPGMHGLDVAARMKEWPQAPDTMLLCLHDITDYQEPARAIGVLGLATKSDFVSELLPAIETLIQAKTGGTVSPPPD